VLLKAPAANPSPHAASIGFIAIGLWLLRALIILAIHVWLRVPKAKDRGAWKHWAAMPVVFTLTIALIYFELPLQLRFQLSVASMTRQAQQAMVAYPTNQSLPDQWIGFYSAEDIAVVEQGKGFLFFIVGTDFLSQSGFAYFPNPTFPI